MSFLIRRNRPLAYAGWEDNFNRPDEDPIQQPWGIGTKSRLNVEGGKIRNNQLILAANYLTYDTGLSYEHQPFTENWGYEVNFLTARQSGAGARVMGPWLGPSWSKLGQSFIGSISQTMGYREPLLGLTSYCGIFIALSNDGVSNVGLGLYEFFAPGILWDGNAHTSRVWIDQDKTIRWWIDGRLVVANTIPERHRNLLQDGRRAINFNNQLFGEAIVDSFKLYDRPSDLKSRWKTTPLWQDDFNRANNTTIGNGWTKQGRTNSVIATNSWSVTAGFGDDYVKWIVQAQRTPPVPYKIEVTLGGRDAPQDDKPQIIAARINEAGTNGIALVFSKNRMQLMRIDKQINVTQFAFGKVLMLCPQNPELKVGDKVALVVDVEDDSVVGMVNDEIRVGYGKISEITSSLDNRFALGLDRSNFLSAGSINDVGIYEEAA